MKPYEIDSVMKSMRIVIDTREKKNDHITAALQARNCLYSAHKLGYGDYTCEYDIAEKTGVSLGYLSEVERGKKEASSEVMESISMALGLRLSDTLRLVATALDLDEADRREVLKSGMLHK